MSQISNLDTDLRHIKQLADLLELQMGKCPASKMKLCTWIAQWARTSEELAGAEKDLPQLPSALRYDYAAWIHDGAK